MSYGFTIKAWPRRREGAVAGEISIFDVFAPLTLGCLVDLVAICQSIDEAQRQGFGAEVGAVVEHFPHEVLGETTSFGDTADDLIELRVDQTLHRLGVRSGKPLFGIAVDRVLELVPLPHLRLDPELFQGPGKERNLVAKSGKPNIPGRLQEDLVEGCGQVVAAVTGTELAESLRVGDGLLAALAESQNRIAQLLQRPQAAG